MTISSGKQHEVGDKGQRFEVTYFDPGDNKRKIYGWSDDAEAACKMGNNIDAHPSWEFPHVTDRQA